MTPEVALPSENVGMSSIQNGPEAAEYRQIPGYIHPTALVETEHIGSGTRIWAFTHLSHGVEVGSNCNIGSHCYLESGVKVGDGATIKNGNYIWDGVTIGNGAFVGPQVVFTNDLHPRSPRLPQAESRYRTGRWLSTTTVEEGASIGGGAVIVAGVTLQKFCMVGAGAVVTKTVPAHCLVVGVPARVAGWVCFCGARLKCDTVDDSAFFCEECLCELKCINGEIRQQE